MHEYIDESKNRRSVIFWIAIISLFISIGITYGVNAIIKLLGDTGEIELLLLYISVVFSVSAGGAFGLIYQLFDKILWKIKIFQNIDLSGEYECHGISKDKTQKEKDEYEATITIKQTWSKITIHLDAELSQSDSFMARVSKNGIGEVHLDYCYTNSTKQTNKNMASKHIGTANIIFSKEIRGKYYNQPDDRMRYGELVLTKKGEKSNEV